MGVLMRMMLSPESINVFYIIVLNHERYWHVAMI